MKHFCEQEGAFLVRDCSRNTTHEPFVLAVFYDKRVFNIQIRFCDETSKYTLGTGLRNSEVSSDHLREREQGWAELQLSCLLSFRGLIPSLTSSSFIPFSPSSSLMDAKCWQKPIRGDTVSSCIRSQNRTWQNCYVKHRRHRIKNSLKRQVLFKTLIMFYRHRGVT